jgi:predicted aldo/keto reductase-like oxidoreductase
MVPTIVRRDGSGCMRYRQLGASGLRVYRCLEVGVNLVDTAWHQAKTAADRLGPADLSLLGPHLPG